LEAFIAEETEALGALAGTISQARQAKATEVAERMGGYLNALKLPPVTFAFETVSLDEHGCDRIDLVLEGSATATLSGGEHNRLRLALMATALAQGDRGQGVVILDEIDANVSGDESIAIAGMIRDLSRVYQVFAISHQPHLAAQADQHILITKSGDQSRAIVLDTEGRIGEIARIVGGEKPNEEAVAFAQRLVGV